MAEEAEMMDDAVDGAASGARSLTPDGVCEKKTKLGMCGIRDFCTKPGEAAERVANDCDKLIVVQCEALWVNICDAVSDADRIDDLSNMLRCGCARRQGDHLRRCRNRHPVASRC